MVDMARVTFVFDDDFDENIYKASYRSRSSLRPIYDTVRRVTDQIYFHARSSMDGEVGRMEANVQAVKDDYSRGGREVFNRAKAIASAVKTARNTLYPSMQYDGKEIFGRVAIGRKHSWAVEFGGNDPTAEIGKGSGRYANLPAYAFLRRAMDRMG